jgi:pyruvate-formate lyase-activating enzyme
MCNGELSSAIRVRREGRPALQSPYGDAFFEELDEFLPHLQAITFLGGEPFLAREAIRVFERLVELELTPYCSVTTNGTQWNDRIERYIECLPMDIAISIDGVSAATLESVRVGVDHNELVRNIHRYHEATNRAGGRMRFSYCLMMPTWQEFGDLLEWADDLDVDVYVNTVHHPPHLSFAHCDLEELESVVVALRDEDARRSTQLTRNRSVWSEQLESIEGLYRQRLGETSAPIAVDEPVATPVSLSTRPGSSSAVAVIRADERQLVNEVLPGNSASFGVPLESLVGSSLWEVVRLISSTLGRLESSDVRRTDEGVEERHLIFEGEQGRTSVSATMNLTDDGGPTWRLRFERLGGDAS